MANGRARQPVADDPALGVVAREPEEPMLSRTPESSPLGKCDERLDVLVPAELKARAARVARIKGFPSAGSYARARLEQDVLHDEAEIDHIVRLTGGDLHWRSRP